ncbi:hypothetical protein GPN2_22309 [Streptomyces murinus]
MVMSSPTTSIVSCRPLPVRSLMIGTMSDTVSPGMKRSTTCLVTGAAEIRRRIRSLRDAARITGPSTGHLHRQTPKEAITRRFGYGTENHRETYGSL